MIIWTVKQVMIGIFVIKTTVASWRIYNVEQGKVRVKFAAFHSKLCALNVKVSSSFIEEGIGFHFK